MSEAGDETGEAELPIARDLFDLLVCPESKAPLKWARSRLVSTDAECRRSYQVVDGIPVMLIEESEVLDAERWRELMDEVGPVGAGVEAVRARDAG